MSGDVQPRKRKDKRKKKEGSSLGNIHEPLGAQPRFKGKSFDEDADASPVFGSVDQGEKIHVHNDHGIGGNICVKIIFFCLFGALITAVAIIFIHSRGSTDVDLPSIEESRFAEYFTGWLDDAPDDHGHDEHEVLHHEDDKLDEEEDEHEGGDDQVEEHDEEEHEEDEAREAMRELEEGEEEKEEYSPEAENEEDDKADDSKENEDEDDDDKDVEDKDADDDDNDAPKFKVVHRFKHFFNKRKQFARDKSEDVKIVKKWSDMKRTKRLRVDLTSEDEVEEIETEEDDEEIDEYEEDEIEKEEETTESEENLDDEDKEKEEEEEEEEEEEVVVVNEEVEELGSEEKEEEEEEHEQEENDEEEESEEYKEKGEVETEEDQNKEIDEEDEVEEPGKNEDQLNDEVDEPHYGYNEEDEEDKIGLDEIDESEEALKEEERLTEEDGGEPGEDNNEAKDESAADEVYEVKSKVIRKEDVKDEEIVEVESKIMDIEEKLNKILREKRKLVEKRKMELEEIKIASLANEEEGEPEKDEDDKQEDEEESSSNGVTIKVLVGIALIIVAHMVLVQKWKAMDHVPVDEKSEGQTGGEDKDPEEESNDIEPVISRRQTLVPETSNLNEYFADEIEGEEEQEEKDEEDEAEELEEEDQDEEVEGEGVSEDYSEEEALLKENRPWSVEHPNRVANLSSEDEDEFSEEEGVEDEEDLDEEIDDEEIEEEEEEEEEEDDYDWKRLESVRREEPVEVEEDIPPLPPPRRSHMHSGERRGGPQGVDEFTYDTFEELWENVDSIGQGELEDEQTPEQMEKDGVIEDEMEDDLFKEDYKFAEDQIDNNPIASLKKYDAILSKKQGDIRALIGRARALDKVAEKEKSNQYLKEAINNYKFVLTTHAYSLQDEQFLEISERCIERMRFGGYFKSAVDIHKALIKKFPATPKYRNDLAVTYLFLNDIPSARNILNETLKMWPKNGFALVHYGFILKTVDNNHEEAADKIIAGIKTREPGVIDGRFFFHLGDALNRIGRGKEAMEWYDVGVKEGLFLSKYQRSLYNVNRLKGQPWWTHEETTYQDFFRKLEKHWQKIRDEGLALLNGKGVNLFKQEAENLKDTGDWRQLDLYFRGRRHSNCDRAPFTCSLISSFHPASTCTRGQVKFSVMLPSTHVWPHCGPTNCRLRSHLGLVVPKNTFLRVAEETRSWEEGKVIVFDDSFEHEVWQNGTSVRLVLIVDVWHPDLTLQERKYLSPI